MTTSIPDTPLTKTEKYAKLKEELEAMRQFRIEMQTNRPGQSPLKSIENEDF